VDLKTPFAIVRAGVLGYVAEMIQGVDSIGRGRRLLMVTGRGRSASVLPLVTQLQHHPSGTPAKLSPS